MFQTVFVSETPIKGLKQERMNLNSENTDNIMLFIFESGNPLIGTIRLTHKRF